VTLSTNAVSVDYELPSSTSRHAGGQAGACWQRGFPTSLVDDAEQWNCRLVRSVVISLANTTNEANDG